MSAKKPATISTVTSRLSEYMAAAKTKALPPEVTEKAKHHILDTLAAMISGAHLPAGVQAIRFVKGYGSAGVASVAGHATQCGVVEAALANGMLAHADETDDSHAPSLSHPGCAVVPAALALAEEYAITGEHFLRAVTLGYDVGPRVTMTLGIRNFYTLGHKSTHSVAGLFGAAAAAACAAGLSAQQMRWVLDYAAQQSSGIASWQRDPDHIAKAFVFGGMPARNGAAAAMMVASGFTAVDDVFSGPDNYFLAFSPEADPNGLVDELGTRYELLRSNIKKWSVGSPIQAPLDAIENLQKTTPFRADDVRRISVRVGDREARVVNNRDMPDVCLQHMLAVMLVDGTISFEASHDRGRMKDAEILRHRRKIELIEDEELGRRLPRREAIVEVELTDGQKLYEHVRAVRGTSDNPMPREEVVRKCSDLIIPVLGDSNGRQLIDAVLGLEKVADMRAIGALVRAGA